MNQYEKVLAAARPQGVNIRDETALAQFLKAQLPDTSRSSSGWLYENGPFSVNAEEAISEVISGGSPLLNWIPSRLVDYRTETVSHLEWIAPEGFDGSETYREWLRGITIDDCEFGPTAVWSGFEYEMSGAEWSFTSPVLKTRDFGEREYANSPIYRVRGGMIGQPLDNDADWATARAMFLMEQHMNYLAVYGDKGNSVMEYDGLDTIIQSGYAQSKKKGPGIPHWANPLVVNASASTTAADILKILRAVVRKQIQRALARKWSLQGGDMAIVMPAGLWAILAEALASGSGYNFDTNSSFNGQMDFRDFQAEYQRITSGGFGFGIIPVDGMSIPVIPDANLGNNVTIDPGGNEKPGIAGDIMILTRRAGGITLLEHQYTNWNAMKAPTQQENIFNAFGGLVRGGWNQINNECFQYYVKAGGRLICNFMPLQARINNIVLETTLESENEAGAFWSPDFYAYDGVQGSSGNALLTAV